MNLKFIAQTNDGLMVRFTKDQKVVHQKYFRIEQLDEAIAYRDATMAEYGCDLSTKKMRRVRSWCRSNTGIKGVHDHYDPRKDYTAIKVSWCEDDDKGGRKQRSKFFKYTRESKHERAAALKEAVAYRNKMLALHY